jgi:hypothetical protein
VVWFIAQTFSLGQFDLWQSDNGTHFRNKAVKTAICTLGGEPIYSAPYHPQCNGQIERPNGIIKRAILLDFQTNKEASIEELFQRALKTYLHHKHSTIDMAPSVAKTLEFSKMAAKHETPLLTTLPQDWRENIDDLILLRLEKAAARTIKKIIRKKKVVKFLTGEIVLMCPHNYQQRKKGTPMWIWQDKVLKRYKNYSYQIEWISQGPTKKDVPGSIVIQWPTWNMRRILHQTPPSKEFGNLFHTPILDKSSNSGNSLER